MKRYPFAVCPVIAVTLVFSLFAIGYGPCSASSHDDRSTMTTERWKSTVDRGGGKGGWTFTKKSDGTVIVTGEWTYLNSITCPFTGGSVTISGPSLLFTVKGTATNSSAPSGYQDSAFALEVKGELRDGKGRGTYAITFSAPEWPSGFSGGWTATRTEGEGVTE
jgi:hypothetical protein